MTLLLFHLQQAYLAVQEAQDEVRRCGDAARAFYGEGWDCARLLPYMTHLGHLQDVMDALAAEGQHLQKGDDV
jgi:hypothetical protein